MGTGYSALQFEGTPAKLENVFYYKCSSPQNILTIKVLVTIIELINPQRKLEKQSFNIAFDRKIGNNEGKGNTKNFFKVFFFFCLL